MAKILVVDDDVGNREMLHMMVGYLGYDAVEACNGMEALRLLRASPDPMIVLLDLMMPTMNGLEVLRVIAADPSLVSHHGYILLTASFERALLSEEQVVRALTIPCLAKPFEMDELHRMVRSVEQRFTPPVQPEQQAS